VKLKHKLFAGYFAVIVLALILCLLALNGYRTVHTHFAAVTQDILPGQQAMVDAKLSALTMVVESRDYLRTGDEIHARYARENMDELQESLRINREHETPLGEEEKGVAEELERRGLDLIELCNDLIDSYQRGAGEKELSEGRENIRLSQDELFELLDAHLLVHEQELTEAQNAIYQTIVTGFRVFAATNVLIWVLGWIIARYSARSILEPIRKLETGAEIIGGGDLSYRLDIKTGDEIEQLAAAFNGMADRLADMVDNLEQRVAERTRDLSASEERFRDVAESSADWIWEVDAAGCYTYCSENIVNVLGYTPEEILGKTPLDLMPPEEASRMSQVLAGIAADKRLIVDLENRNLTQDGREVILLTNGVPILDSEGNLLGYRGVDQDITERVRAEEALRESEKRFREMASLLPQVVGETDLRGNFTFVNQNAFPMFGYTREDFEEGINVLQVLIPEDRERAKENIQKVLKGEEGPGNNEYTAMRKDGSTFPILIYSSPTIRQNKPAGMISVVVDITERVRAEDALRESEERFRAVFETAQDSIFIKDRALRYTQVNPAMERLFGLPALELIGLTDENLFGEAAGAHVREVDSRVLGGEIIEEEHTKPVEGIPTTFHTIKVPMRDASGEIIGVCGIARDTTERVRAEEALQRERDRAQRYLDIAGVMLVALNKKGEITLVNRKGYRILEYEEGELVGRNWFDTCLPTQTARDVRSVFEQLMAGEVEPVEFYENPVLTKSGAERVVAWHNTVLTDEAGAITGILSSGEDITERKRAEAERERLLAAEREQRLLAETLREVTLALTSQTQHAAVLDEILRQAQRLVPYRAANIALLEGDILRVARWRGYGAFGDREAIADLVQPVADVPLDAEAIRSQTPVIIPDTQQESRWGILDQVPWIRSYLTIPLCLRGRVLGLLRMDGVTPGEFSAGDAERLQPLANAAAIAIENARLVEGLEEEVAIRTAEIVTEKEKSETILQSVDDAITMSDLEMKLRYVNPAFTALTGYPAQEVIGKHVSFLFRLMMPEQDRQSLRLTLAQGEVWRGEVSSQRKDGRPYQATMTIAPMRDADGRVTGYVSSHRDITKFKELEQARNRFMTNVSHELRTPVTSLKLYADLLRRQSSPERIERFLRTLDEQIERLSALIQDLLQMAELDGGLAVQIWEPVYFSTVIRDAVGRYQSQAEAAGLTLTASTIPPDLPPVKGDQGRLAQALAEVVENAIIFTSMRDRDGKPAPAGGRVTVEVGAVEDDGRQWVTMTVRDTGPGISAEEQELVFDRFFRGELAASGHVPGTGLGLSITREILQAHGGRVTVESKVGQSSVFTLWLRAEAGRLGPVSL